MASPSSSTTIDRGYNVLYITLGCAKNEVDTDRMRARLLASGFGEVVDPDSADVAIINTCSFLASATEDIRLFSGISDISMNRISTEFSEISVFLTDPPLSGKPFHGYKSIL